MRYLIIAGLLAISPIANAAEPCDGLAVRISEVFEDFPTIIPESGRSLGTWRASCAEVVPTGEGVVQDLCEAEAVEGPRVFYWSKSSENGDTGGYARCVY